MATNPNYFAAPTVVNVLTGSQWLMNPFQYATLEAATKAAQAIADGAKIAVEICDETAGWGPIVSSDPRYLIQEHTDKIRYGIGMNAGCLYHGLFEMGTMIHDRTLAQAVNDVKQDMYFPGRPVPQYHIAAVIQPAT